MEKVRVLEDACIGCGLCQSIAPEVFEIKEDGFSSVKENQESNVNEDVKEAADGCPTSAIDIYEEN